MTVRFRQLLPFHPSIGKIKRNHQTIATSGGTSDMQQVTQGFGISFFGVFFFIIVLVIVLYVYISKTMKNRRERVDTPFEEIDGGRPLFQIDFKSRKTRIVALSLITVIAVASIAVLGQMPVHRTNIEHTDPLGDVADADVDIVNIKSYLNGTDLYLQLTVAGNIVETNATVRYQYNINIVGKRVTDTEGHLYGFTFENGSMGVSTYTSNSFVSGDTLTIVTPISTLLPGVYMIGLEAHAQTVYGQDYTAEDRDGEIAHLLF